MSISQEATELSNKLNAITRKEQRQVYLKRYNTRRGLFRICDKPLGFCTSQVAMTENTCDKDNQKELRLLCTSRLKYCLLDTQQKIR